MPPAKDGRGLSGASAAILSDVEGGFAEEVCNALGFQETNPRVLLFVHWLAPGGSVDLHGLRRPWHASDLREYAKALKPTEELRHRGRVLLITQVHRAQRTHRAHRTRP